MKEQNPLIKRAYQFAAKAHDGHQRNFSSDPYILHLIEVAALLSFAGMPPVVVASGLLHDCVEDRGVTFDELTGEFGREVAGLVQEVTNVTTTMDGNRKARFAIELEHIKRASPNGKSIKLADITSNCRTIRTHNPKFAPTYLREKAETLPFLTEGHPWLFEIASSFVRDGNV